MKKLSYWTVLLLTTAGVLAGCGEEEEAAGEETGVSGDLHFYTSQPDEDADRLVSAFNEKYPEVNVNTFRSGTEEVISKVQAENQAGDIQADVMLVADSVTFERLKQQDLLMSYESEEKTGIPEEFIDADHTYYGTKIMATILAVNTNQVDEMPSSWDVLTSEKAKEEAVMPSPLYSGAAAYNVGVMSRQEAFGWDYFEQLHENDITIVQGNGGVLQEVAAGEKSYGMVVDFIVARAKQEGSPVELVYPEEGVPVITEPIGIMNETENEEAAKAFVDFVLSEKGQNVSAEVGYTPIKEGVDAPEGLKTSGAFQILSHNEAELLETREEDKQRFSDMAAQ
ncbi:iron(III) transport system substrate-binding protein [Alteribacillus persepolensis]|uniref:Iron(III) transport system substrate-binding protein n=1 Tax=Alteribacillus persepolensis TaxID=568899 RepID=A0A1G8GJM1_9BACI|nr:ABC transporter substrate-binding protein [Alteribacillus persepolensis]SDH94573.1 iron(III) transport system substrate-binding protein [Alteribacillus persepolensis]